MEVYCTRPNCPRPPNSFTDLNDSAFLKTVQQKYCTTCGMPLILAGRYLPMRLLGQGGFGAAFLARDRYTPAMRQCVVKLLKPAGNLTQQQLQTAQKLFEREAAVLEELGNEHPQIPDLLAFFELTVSSVQSGKEEKLFYLVQEFIDGRNLEEELASKGAFSEAEVLEVLQETLKILQFVHDRGSIHRDIKPANIIRGRNGRLYLLDFGAVKQVTQTASASPSTGIYSLGYAPPEQMNGREVYPSTDLYALAVTCLVLLTGQQPPDLFDAYRNEWNWRSRVQVSDRFAQVLDRMLLPAPSLRFQSAAEVEESLSQPRSSPPPSVPTAPPPPAPLPPVTPRPGFSVWEMLGNAAFTGFEGSLLAIAIGSFLGTTLTGYGIWIVLLGVLVAAQWRRIIEKTDLLIIGGISLALVLSIPALRTVANVIYPGASITAVVLVAGLATFSAIAIAALFRLIYNLVSKIL